MNTHDDAVRLRLAVEAFRAARPTEAEVERGARRALSALRRGGQRRRSSWVPVVVVAILAFGTLAYAKPSGVATLLSTLLDGARQARSGDERRARGESVPAILPTAVPISSAAPARPPEAREPAPPAPVVAPTTPTVESRRTGPARRRPVDAKPSRDTKPSSEKPGWDKVTSALGAGDSDAALRALSELQRSGDAATRAKAEFGMAQLAWARGDRPRACALARRAASGGADQRTRERALALLTFCQD